MSIFSNIWNHPKTSAAGLLIAIVSIAGALSQQGITFGAAGNGSIVTLVSAIASALLGLLAKDPGEPAGGSSGAQSRLGAWALIALLLQLPWMGGCSTRTAAQNIVNWTPALRSAVAAVDTAGGALSPDDARAFAEATKGFDAAAEVMVAQAKAYLENPSASTLAQMQNQVVTFQQLVNAAMLQAARITNPGSQQRALMTIQAVGTAVTAILALVQTISSKSAVEQMAARSAIKIAAVRPYSDVEISAEIVAAHYGEPVATARMQLAQVLREEALAGF